MQYSDYKSMLLNADAGDRVREDFLERHKRITNCEYDTLGVKTPSVKKLAKSVPSLDLKQVFDACFADVSENPIFETVLFCGYIAARKGDYEFTSDCLKKLIPLFGSWAHDDCIVPCLKWAADDILRDFEYLYHSDRQYEKRFYIICLMDFCLTEERVDFALDRFKNTEFGDYYVDMAVAWAVSEAAVKFFDKTVALLEERKLPKFVQNKAIQKARESFRLTPEQKAFLTTLKI